MVMGNRGDDLWFSWTLGHGGVDPDSPAGGSGLGKSRRPGPVNGASGTSAAPHPDAPAKRHGHHQHRRAVPKARYDDTLFREKAPFIMTLLMRDFDLTAVQAAAIMGNIGHECNEFHAYHEIGQPEGRGGYGWAQWTGPRRQKFFNWLARNIWVFSWKSDIANYLYLRDELKTEQKSAVQALKKQ